MTRHKKKGGKEATERKEGRQILDFITPSMFPLVRADALAVIKKRKDLGAKPAAKKTAWSGHRDPHSGETNARPQTGLENTRWPEHKDSASGGNNARLKTKTDKSSWLHKGSITRAKDERQESAKSAGWLEIGDTASSGQDVEQALERPGWTKCTNADAGNGIKIGVQGDETVNVSGGLEVDSDEADRVDWTEGLNTWTEEEENSLMGQNKKSKRTRMQKNAIEPFDWSQAVVDEEEWAASEEQNGWVEADGDRGFDNALAYPKVPDSWRNGDPVRDSWGPPTPDSWGHEDPDPDSLTLKNPNNDPDPWTVEKPDSGSDPWWAAYTGPDQTQRWNALDEASWHPGPETWSGAQVGSPDLQSWHQGFRQGKKKRPSKRPRKKKKKPDHFKIDFTKIQLLMPKPKPPKKEKRPRRPKQQPPKKKRKPRRPSGYSPINNLLQNLAGNPKQNRVVLGPQTSKVSVR